MTIMGLLFGTDKIKTSVGYMELDVSLEEVHSFANDVTRNPVEDGEPTSDHIIPIPDTVRLRGLTSTAALGEGLLSFVGLGTASAVQDAFETLYELKEARELVTIVTPMKTYEDMAVQSIDFPRMPRDGESVQYTIECTHVRRVLSKTTELPPGIGETQAPSVEGRAKVEAKHGQQQNRPVSGKGESILKGVLG